MNKIETGLFVGMNRADYDAIPAINASGLDLIKRTPLHYWATYLSPNKKPRKETKALYTGTANHCAVFEPDRFTRDYAVFQGDLRTKDGKAVYQSIIDAGKLPLSDSEFEQATSIATSLKKHPAAQELLNRGHAEAVLVWVDKEFGVPCKGRLDWLSLDDWIVDLKSTTDASEREFARSIGNYGYHRRAAWYVDGFRQTMGRDPKGFIWAAAEREAPYASAWYIASRSSIDVGHDANRRLLRTYAECLRLQQWPGFPDEIREIELPEWALGKGKPQPELTTY